MTNAERLGYRTNTDKSVECKACGQKFAAHGFAVEGSVLRSHRRNCTIAPAYVTTPGVCDA